MRNAMNDSAGKETLIIIANNLDDYDLLSIVDNLEFPDQAVVVCDNSFLRKHKPKMLCLGDNFTDSDRLVTRLRKLQKKSHIQYSGIIGLDEEHHYMISHKIADAFELNYYCRKLLDIASNKYLQKEALFRIGLSRAFELTKGATKIKYPNVLRPICGLGSILSFVNHNQTEYEQNLRYIRRMSKSEPFLSRHYVEHENLTYHPKKQFLIEDYIPGDEYSCDFLVDNGTVEIIRIVKKIRSNFFGFFDGFCLFNPKEADFDISLLKHACEKIQKELEIPYGVCMVDFKVDNEIVVLETTVRPGIATFIDLMAHIYHDTSINKLMRQLLGKPVSCIIPETHGMVLYLVAPRPGILKSFDTSYLEKNKKELGIIKIVRDYDVGDIIRKKRKLDYVEQIVGHVLLKDVHDPAEIIKNINNNVIIQVESWNGRK